VEKWISDGSAIGYDLSALNSSSFPKIGIAISSGGYRAGVLDALDARNKSAEVAGTGGLLQVTSYLSRLSGASRFLFKYKIIDNYAWIHVRLT
jgi:lysophospholipase